MKQTFVLLAGIALACWLVAGCSKDQPTNNNGGTVLDPPTSLTAAWISQTQILLRWRDHSTGEEGFEIYESIHSDSSFQLITTTAPNADSVIIGNRNPAQLYVYKVRAKAGIVRSAFSNEVRVGGGNLYKTLSPASGPVQTIAYSPVAGLLAGGCGDYHVRVWDASTGSVMQVSPRHVGPVEWLCYSPGGGRIVSESHPGLIVWNTGTGESVYTLQGTHPYYSTDNRYLAFSADSCIYLLNPITFDTMRTLRKEAGYGFRVVGFSKDGRWMITDAADGIAKWDMHDSTATGPVHQRASHILGALASSSSGDYVIATTDSSSLIIMRLDDGSVISQPTGGSKGCYSAAFSPDESIVATSWGDWSIRIFNVETGELTRVLSGHTYIPYQVAWSPDGRYLASASGDQTIKIWGPFK